jgi:hypothetical protein
VHEIWKAVTDDNEEAPKDKVGDPEVKPTEKGAPFTPDQEALVELAKEAKRTGVTAAQAEILLEWAREYGLPHRGPEVHPGRKFKEPHIHIGPVNHIPVR